jgi:hypothetical protein
MAVLRDDLTQQHAQRALMTAIRVSDKCLELRRVTHSILKIFERTQAGLPLPNLLAWKEITEDILARIAEVLADASGRHSELRTSLSASVSEHQFPDPYRLFVYRAQTSFPVGRQPARLDLLLIALLCTAAGSEATLSEDVANGMRQAYKAIANDSRNHWRDFAGKAPLDVKELDALLQATKSEVVKEFLRQVRVYLLTPIAAPKAGLVVEPQTESDKGKEADTNGRPADRGSPGRSSRPGKAEAARPRGTHEPHETVAPTIAAALREAQLSPLGAKAGVGPLWDVLTPDELAAMTRKLHADLVGDDLKRAVIAVIALVALLVSFNPKAARLLETPSGAPSDQTEIWIDVQRGWLCWWQYAYTESVEGGPPSTGRRTEDRIFNIIPMPESLAARIRELHLAAGDPKLLKAALDHPFGSAGLLMAEVNARLKELGDQVHLAEPTRFASSLGQFVIEVFGSDMAAGHLMQFTVCPTSAPFYFSPRTDWLAEMFTRLYERLGLGRPVSMEGAPARQGAGVGHETSKLRSGFDSLVEDVIRLSDAVQAWASDDAGIEAIAQLAPRCGELFHIPIGGRGSEPGRITTASVTAGRGMFALMDKKTDGDKSPRVLPHTALTSAGRRQLSWPVDDNYPGRWRRGSFVVVVGGDVPLAVEPWPVTAPV